MNKNEYKELTYQIVPKLKEHFKSRKEDVEVLILQDTLSGSNHPFNQPSLIIGVGYKGTNFYEVYQVTNNGNECSWKFAGNTQAK